MSEHAVCEQTIRTIRAEFSADLRQARIDAGADAEIGQRLRLLLRPGVNRKMYRADELRALVDDVTARWNAAFGDDR